MFAFTHLSLAAAVLSPALFAQAAKILVQVGPEGEQIFSPSNITANVGDVVSFAFLTKNHSVTQSSFASPCKPLAGGVDSGFQSVSANATNIPEFSIAINNTSKPLFFFSAQTVPTNECQRGMVFSINQAPNSAKSFAAFQAAAVASATATGAASATPSAAAKSSGSEIVVQVGANNSDVFSPSNISANIGDIVTFQFVSKNHSVTQTTFAKPCSALLAGGVNSGFQPVPVNAAAFPTFSFAVNNASTPLFFTSTQAALVECNKGMVFSINQDPNSAKSFADFQANAEADVPPSKTGAAAASAAPPATTSPASNILVLVGANNSDIFSPSNISANVGDVVTFQFVSKNHSVTQTTFAKPCSVLLAGGVDSGFQPALLNAPAFPTFSFTVNNVSTPLFFTSTQAAECNKGMVFSINQDPNSAVKSFADFQANAEADVLPAAKAGKQGRRMHARDFVKTATVWTYIMVDNLEVFWGAPGIDGGRPITSGGSTLVPYYVADEYPFHQTHVIRSRMRLNLSRYTSTSAINIRSYPSPKYQACYTTPKSRTRMSDVRALMIRLRLQLKNEPGPLRLGSIIRGGIRLGKIHASGRREEAGEGNGAKRRRTSTAEESWRKEDIHNLARCGHVLLLQSSHRCRYRNYFPTHTYVPVDFRTPPTPRELRSAIPAGVRIHTAFALCSPLAAGPLLSPAAPPLLPPPRSTQPPRSERRQRAYNHDSISDSDTSVSFGRMGGTRNLDPYSVYDPNRLARTSEGRAHAPEEDRAARLRQSGRDDAACGVRAEEGAEGEGAASACRTCGRGWRWGSVSHAGYMPQRRTGAPWASSARACRGRSAMMAVSGRVHARTTPTSAGVRMEGGGLRATGRRQGHAKRGRGDAYEDWSMGTHTSAVSSSSLRAVHDRVLKRAVEAFAKYKQPRINSSPMRPGVDMQWLDM
ncbi:hypothetical protein B0H14DRAFT_3153069 [Mycena olivaceomarginata]|nr:hypothetical protein B0H14DRAFT_3153069 [Mycena olivaceomarginata]